MKNEIREIFTQNAQMSGANPDDFFQMIDTDDKEFDEIFPYFEAELKTHYSSKNYQEQMIAQLQQSPMAASITLENEIEAGKELLKLVDEDDSLSDNKKKLFHIMIDSTTNVISDIFNAQRVRIDVGIVKIDSEAIIPQYAHSTDAGADIFALEDTEILPNETKLVRTGLAVAIPEGYEIQIRPRSGISLKTSLRIANSPSTIDSSYRGEVKVIISNTGKESYTIHKHDKIAQMLIAATPMIRWNEYSSIEDLGETDRGNGGFGSTDKS